MSQTGRVAIIAGGYVLRPMQGKMIAQALAELRVATYTDQIRKWYSSNWQPHQDLGWQIRQRSVIDLSRSDSAGFFSTPDYPRFCMDSHWRYVGATRPLRFSCAGILRSDSEGEGGIVEFPVGAVGPDFQVERLTYGDRNRHRSDC
jgi:hypothetical protein